jgi:hypothetical protein
VLDIALSVNVVLDITQSAVTLVVLNITACVSLQEALHYSNSLASAEVVLNIHRSMIEAVHTLHTKSYSDREKIVLLRRVEELLREERMWRESQLRFCDRLSRLYCGWYPDMVVPLLCAATQVNLMSLLQ